ncbi:serine protease [Szabonella alba]|uniref:Serine protease n=1 Tax=Szabonella alba TaxID=2804194 RepID=A0A8K0V6N9_9RHOB|nr:serine protease [Szabonella alba]MBL4916166.1 serine protease [Szabonella alba]
MTRDFPIPAFPIPALTAVVTAALTALPALAQDRPDFAGAAAQAANPALASPFAFAEAGLKAARVKKAETAEEGARIIGGQVAEPGAWPWQVGFMINGAPMSPEGHFCGGSMLLDRWVLTAAHCVHMADNDGNFGDVNPRAISVLAGTNTIAPGEGDLVPVDRIFVHPDYRGTEFDNDIALVKLARAPQTRYSTITVPDAEFGDYLDQPGVITLVTGWGLTEGGSHPEQLRQVEIQMMDRNLCNQVMLENLAEEAVKGFAHAVQVFGLNEDDAYRAWDVLVAGAKIPMSTNMLCSGTYEGGKTACSGDSGGPLMVQLQDGNFIQAGVVSWGLSGAGGKGCDETAPFSAYTRVSNYLPWLNSVIGAN